MSCYATKKDSDVCLQLSHGWESWNCRQAVPYCNNKGWAKDPWRCCPETCQLSEPFTEKECKQSTAGGSCTYPFYALPEQCSEGSLFLFCIKLLKKTLKQLVNYVSFFCQ